MEQEADAELVARVHAGQKEAFEQLIERYQQMVTRIARGMIADAGLADELTQEAILQAYLSLDHLRDATRFKSWLYGITLNVCRHYLRDRQVDMLSLEAMMGGMHVDVATFLADTIDPQMIAEERELHRMVLQAVEGLSLKDRETTLLFYYEQLTLQEIAVLLDISVGAVKGRLHRARKLLRAQLATLYADVGPGTRKDHVMLKVTIDEVRSIADAHNYVIALKSEDRRSLFIWIGKAEALALAAALNEVPSPRPMTADFMVNMFQAMHIELVEVRIEALKDEVFYAMVKLRNGDIEREIDARPSDALSLAVHMNCPIYVADEVMQRCGQLSPERQVPMDGSNPLDREAVLKEMEARWDPQKFAAFVAALAERQLHKEKQEREQAKQEMISKWKQEHRSSSEG